MFQTSHKDFSEALCLLQLLCADTLDFADAKGNCCTQRPLHSVRRKEENGWRTYQRERDCIVIHNDNTPDTPLRIEASLWEEATQHAFHLLRTAPADAPVSVDDALEAFFDDIQLLSIVGTGEGQHHLLVQLADEAEGLATVLSCVGANPSLLLDGGRKANMKLEQTGTRFATPMAAKVNALESEHTVRDRMLLVERMGSTLRYHNVADRVFRGNLALLDLHLGRLLTEMLRCSYHEELLRLDELTAAMNITNPLKVPTEYMEKHHYYEQQVERLLLACLAGLRPGKIYTGQTSLPPYVLLLRHDGSLRAFRGSEREVLGQFLFHHTRLVRGSREKDKYGLLERENNVYYFKLNLKIGLTKR